MKELKIYEFQAKQIEDTFRLVARALDSKTKTTSVDRDVMQSWEMIKNVLAKKIDTHVPRFQLLAITNYLAKIGFKNINTARWRNWIDA